MPQVLGPPSQAVPARARQFTANGILANAVTNFNVGRRTTTRGLCAFRNAALCLRNSAHRPARSGGVINVVIMTITTIAV
ncbi:hypothetical protein AYO47_09655 [Planctomyces sp. SCGC AG-212-M04]|nr:hypothetical protein AYO47_09655 [Planctomyces sp. SCGC AG-212-M04]